MLGAFCESVQFINCIAYSMNCVRIQIYKLCGTSPITNFIPSPKPNRNPSSKTNPYSQSLCIHKMRHAIYNCVNLQDVPNLHIHILQVYHTQLISLLWLANEVNNNFLLPFYAKYLPGSYIANIHSSQP